MKIERTTEIGYKEDDLEVDKAIDVLNLELENKRTIWIDGKMFEGDIISEQDITKAKNISVTNKLVGG